ncbi:TPA: hypothetical protein QB630_002135 [Pasteurella multocida]|nr:hypothetical protein [Pasteurella multocida]HDR1884409.1 hypothetical protein [Pasteurella multocida]
MQHYELNPNSPFYSYMQDTSVEQSLSEIEREQRKKHAINSIVIWELECMGFTADEHNYLIYAFINDIEPDIAFKNLTKNANHQKTKPPI